MRRMIRTTVSAPHTTSSQNNPGVIDHLGTDVEPVPKAAADKLWLWPPQPSFRTRAPSRNYRPVGKARGGVFGAPSGWVRPSNVLVAVGGNQPENVSWADFAGCTGAELCYNNKRVLSRRYQWPRQRPPK